VLSLTDRRSTNQCDHSYISTYATFLVNFNIYIDVPTCILFMNEMLQTYFSKEKRSF